MIVCSKCGYENLDDALYCNLCKEIFRKEKKEIPAKDKITSFYDLPPEIRDLLQKQKAEIMSKNQEISLLTSDSLKKWCILFVIVGIGMVALILLRFFFTIPVK